MTDQEADSSLEEELIEHYHDDLPSPATLQQELHMWKCKWKLVEKGGLPDTPSKSLEHANESMFPNIHILLRKGGLHQKPKKLEHIFVAVITFFPFLLCKYF